MKLSCQARAALPAKPGVALGRLTDRRALSKLGRYPRSSASSATLDDWRYRHTGLGSWIGFGSTPALTGLARLATALAAEVTVWRDVQQTYSGRMPLDAFRVTMSGLAPLVQLSRIHTGPPSCVFRGQVAPSELVERQATLAVLTSARRRGLSVLRLRQAM